ncbi:MAG TPA: type VI secretion protein IcmF/TssM N-terminal domain-containing protein, partial [Pyrinomonadaceae bacterium]|nr:type VI secretion protein IcmF/TssM N-terminal domain-containing protein [Pyrinomonadaceae bacterium]
MGLPVNTRIMVIIVLLLTLPFTLLTGYVVSRRSKKKEEKAKKEAEEKKEAKESAPAAEQPAPVAAAKPSGENLQGAEEVVKFLRSSNLGDGADALYSLPWYIVAGVPKSGKSSVVVGSNLNFQALPSQRQSEMKIIKPTQNVDWRVTTDAVFIDTAGRFQTEGGDTEEWASLLETIRKTRPNRPLDGMLLFADTDRVLEADERELEESAKIMRTRLDEAMQRLKVRFPVYLIFNHADSIEGFRDSFSTSKKEGETLVWGATIPLEKSENAHSMFDDEFALLNDSIMKRRLMRLSAPFPPVRQLRIFNFPLHFSAARRKLGAFVTALFRPNPFTENPFFRGFYFTSTPAAGRGDAPATVGTTYFVERLIRDVVLRDKDLVRTFQEQRQRPPIFGWLVTMLGAAIVATLLIIAGVSTYNNQKMLDDASKRALSVLNNAKADVNRDPLTKSPDESTSEINALENLRLLMDQLDRYNREGAPIKMRMGLYSGDRIYTERLLPIYYTAVSRRFMDPTRRRMEEEMKKFVASPPIKDSKQLSPEEETFLGANYDLLKVYLMLTDEYRDKANETDVYNTLNTYWFASSKLPESLETDAEKQLKFYARQVDRTEGVDRFPRYQANGNLVTEVRNKLKAFPAEQRYYRRKVTEISKEIDAKKIMSVDAILQREGGVTGIVTGDYTVPGAYTVEGFKEMEKAIALSSTELAGCDWVIEEKCDAVAEVSKVAQTADGGKIRDRYLPPSAVCATLLTSAT